ncbi:MAG: helix-turn-helix domain-containing protein [Thermoanaerobaculia bacterium]
MKKKGIDGENTLTGRHARRIDLAGWIRAERRKSRTFRDAFAEAHRATEIARELARLRHEQGVSQAEIARRLKTSQQAVSRLEHPDYEGHSLRTLARYAESLGKELRFVLSEPGVSYGAVRAAKRRRKIG